MLIFIAIILGQENHYLRDCLKLKPWKKWFGREIKSS